MEGEGRGGVPWLPRAAVAKARWTNSRPLRAARLSFPIGGVVPGFGDLREIDLLAEAGFSAPQAVKIATYNGAYFLGLADRIGTVAAGKDADLVVLKGDSGRPINDIENVEIVFKDGIGYDPSALLQSVRGRYGEY